MNEPRMVIVHHTAVSSPYGQIQGVNEYHKRRDFPRSSLGWYVGYHYFIERDGTMIKCKEESEEGAHTQGYNFVSIGVCMAGNFDIEIPTEKQQESLGNILRDVIGKYKISVTQIRPHRYFANKSCYGSLLDDQWAAREYLKAELSVITKLLASIRLWYAKR